MALNTFGVVSSSAEVAGYGPIFDKNYPLISYFVEEDWQKHTEIWLISLVWSSCDTK